MRVWKLCIHDDAEGTLAFVWFTTRAKLDAAMRMAREKHRYVDYEAIDIEITRQGLVDFLNKNLTRSSSTAKSRPSTLHPNRRPHFNK